MLRTSNKFSALRAIVLTVMLALTLPTLALANSSARHWDDDDRRGWRDKKDKDEKRDRYKRYKRFRRGDDDDDRFRRWAFRRFLFRKYLKRHRDDDDRKYRRHRRNWDDD
ncbi:MAG TPA: hypothetical protein VNO70_10885 [Blastocatellia bacterium]|nr:hypothetical protein [Blastocatellia bacterium]